MRATAEHYPADMHTEVVAVCACGHKVSTRSRRDTENDLAAHIADCTDHWGERGDGYEGGHF